MDTWDDENIKVQIKFGNTLAIDQTIGPLNTNGGAGCANAVISKRVYQKAYTKAQGDIEVKITNTLDEPVDNESIGYSQLRLDYEIFEKK